MNSKPDANTLSSSVARNALPLLLIGTVVTTLAGCGLLNNPDYKKLEGVWEAKMSDSKVVSLVVEDDSVLFLSLDGTSGGHPPKGRLELTSRDEQKQFVITFPKTANQDKEVWRGIYELSDKRIRAALNPKGDGSAPLTFTEKNTWNFEWKGKSANLAPADPNYVKGVRTWHYWKALEGINSSNTLADPFANAKSPEQVIVACNQAIETLGTIRSQIAALPIADVDSEVTSYASEYLDNLNMLESVLGEIVPIIKDAQELAAISTSDEAAGMVIIDLFLGRPGATIDALNAEVRRLGERALAVQNRARRGADESGKLETKQLKLRSYLSDKYSRDFPQFKI